MGLVPHCPPQSVRRNIWYREDSPPALKTHSWEARLSVAPHSRAHTILRSPKLSTIDKPHKWLVEGEGLCYIGRVRGLMHANNTAQRQVSWEIREAGQAAAGGGGGRSSHIGSVENETPEIDVAGRILHTPHLKRTWLQARRVGHYLPSKLTDRVIWLVHWRHDVKDSNQTLCYDLVLATTLLTLAPTSLQDLKRIELRVFADHYVLLRDMQCHVGYKVCLSHYHGVRCGISAGANRYHRIHLAQHSTCPLCLVCPIYERVCLDPPARKACRNQPRTYLASHKTKFSPQEYPGHSHTNGSISASPAPKLTSTSLSTHFFVWQARIFQTKTSIHVTNSHLAVQQYPNLTNIYKKRCDI